MCKTKYLLLDDELNRPNKNDSFKSFIDFLQRDGNLLITTLAPGEISKLLIDLKRELEDSDGLIIDLQLGDIATKDKIRSVLNAPPIAQQIREWQANKKLKEFPIILCSTNNNIRKLYLKDITSHDLFDHYITKNYDDNNDNEDIVRILVALAKGYKTFLKSKASYKEWLGVTEEDYDLNPFFYLTDTRSKPIHVLVKYILKELLEKSGPLINEKLFAARLGIDIEKSMDWGELVKQYFLNARYVGVFSDWRKNYWMGRISNSFCNITGHTLNTISAVERVELLKSKTKLTELVPAKPINKCNSTYYWALCKGYDSPIDPNEAYRVLSVSDPMPWQEYEYVSLDAMLNRKGFENGEIVIHPLDRKRFSIDKRRVDEF